MESKTAGNNAQLLSSTGIKISPGRVSLVVPERRNKVAGKLCP